MLAQLECNNITLDDEVVSYLANFLVEPQACKFFNRLSLCKCKLTNKGLVYLLNALQYNKPLRHLRLTENYFAENGESLIIEVLSKNTTLLDIAMQGNRLSHTCLLKIKKI